VAPAVSAIAAVEERLAELRGGERGQARTQLLDLVVLTDEPPEGFEYLWGSARALGHAVAVEGTGPFQFSLADLPAGQSAILTYRALDNRND